jgi:hypothetical protein
MPVKYELNGTVNTSITPGSRTIAGLPVVVIVVEETV